MLLSFPGHGAKGVRPAQLFLNRDLATHLGVVALWPLGATVGQELVSNQTAVPFNGATVAGRPNSGLAGFFDGSNDYYAPATRAGIPNIEAAMTLACRVWVHPSVSVPTRLIALALVKDDSGSAGNAINISMSDHLSLWCTRVEGWGSTICSGSEASAAGGVAPQRWIDLVVTQTSAGAVTLYISGVSVTTGSTSQTGTTGVLRIGSLNAAFPTPYFSGWIADVTIAKRVWTPSEVWAYSNPATRWDLYWQPGRRLYLDLSAAAGATRTNRLPLLGVA